MVKLTVEQFRLVRKEFQKLIDNYQVLAEANKDNPNFDEEKEQQIVLDKYFELQTDLLNYDLSEIPFEEWDDFTIIPLGKVDFSKTGANLDFDIINYQPGTAYFGGCNVRNLDRLYDGVNPDDFDQTIIDSNSDIFLSDSFSDEFKSKYYAREVSISDFAALTNEQLTELSSKKYRSFISREYFNNFLVKHLPLDKVIELYNLDSEYFNSLNQFDFYNEELNSKYINLYLNCNESNFKSITMDLFGEQLKVNNYNLDPSSFLSDFVKLHPDVFLVDAPIPENIKRSYYSFRLDAKDFIDYIEYFGKSPFLDRVLTNSFIREMYGFKEDKLVISNLIQNNKELFKYLLDNHFYISYNAPQSLDGFYKELHDYVVRKNTDSEAFKNAFNNGEFDWLKSLFDNVIVKVESIEDLNNLSDSTFIFDNDQYNFFNTFGIDNLKRFVNEYKLFELSSFYHFNSLISVYNSNKLDYVRSDKDYEVFLDNMEILLANVRKSREYFDFNFLNDTFGKVRPNLFLNIDDKSLLYYNHQYGQVDITALLRSPEFIDELIDRDLSLDINEKIFLKLNGKYSNFIRSFTKVFGNKAFFDLVFKYKKYLKDLTIVVNEEELVSIEQVECAIRNAILDKYLRDYSYNKSFKDLYDIDGFYEQFPNIFFDFNTIDMDEKERERLESEFYSSKFSLDNFKKYPFLVDVLKDTDINFYLANILNRYYGMGVDKEEFFNYLGMDEFYSLARQYGNLFELVLRNISLDYSNKEKFISNPREYIEDMIYEKIITGNYLYDDKVSQGFKDKHKDLFLSEDVNENIRDRFYKRELTLNDFVNDESLLESFGDINILFGFPINVFRLSKVTSPDHDSFKSNYYRLKVLEEYYKLKDQALSESYLEYFEEFGESFDIDKLEHVVKVLWRLKLSNSGEIRHIKRELANQILRTDDPIESLDKVEDIFIKNNLPYVGKIYSCFQVLHPDFKGFNIDSSEKVSPVLKDATPKLRNAIVFADLIKISLGSNNRSMINYLDNLEIGSRIVGDLSSGVRTFDDLTEEELVELSTFTNHLYTLYNNTVKGKREEEVFVLSGNLRDDINTLIGKFSPDGKSIDYNLGDRIVRMFCGIAGIDTVEQAKSYLTVRTSLASENHFAFDPEKFKLEPGDLVKGIGDNGIRFLGNILQNGSVAKEYLGSSATSDLTPLDTDLSIITVSEDNIERQMNATEANSYGEIYIVLKGNDRFYTTRTIDGPIDVKRDTSKIEVFYTGAVGNTHYGIRTGFSSTDIDCFLVKRWDDRIGLEIAMNGFYIPVIDFKKNLLFTPQDYKDLRSKMSGLSYFGEDTYNFGEDLVSEDVEEVLSDIEASKDSTKAVKDEIGRRISDALKLSGIRRVYNGFSGDLTSKSAEVYDTGSTARDTCVPGDSDFDYLIKIDKEYFEQEGMLEQFKEFLNQQLGLSNHPSGKITGVINVDGFEADVEISFTNKTNSIDFSTDAALSQRLDNIRKQDPEKYRYVIANIVLAKKVMKEFNVYKSAKSNPTHGGLGGIGIENWILQNGGSFRQAAESFLKAAEGKTFEEFTRCYYVYDFGSNHYADNEDSNKFIYPHENFVYQGDMKMTAEGYKKMCNALKTYFKLHNIEEELEEEAKMSM